MRLRQMFEKQIRIRRAGPNQVLFALISIYKTYGDTRVIRKFWPNMVAYLKFMEDKE
jgi:hypothetical protein